MEMRNFSEFCQQLHDIRLKFHKWDNCEKTVGLYYLMVGLPFTNARFLQYALEQCLTTIANTQEAQQYEKNANNALFIKKISSESEQQIALNLLLKHLPLLKPDNNNRECTNCYLTMIKRVLTDILTIPPSSGANKIYNECIELMSYVFIHPAFNKNDKKNFKYLLKEILTRINPNSNVQTNCNNNNESSDECCSSPKPEKNVHFKTKVRSNSLTPSQTTTTTTTDNLVKEIWSSSQENLLTPQYLLTPHQNSLLSQSSQQQQQQKPRSYSLSINDKSMNLSSLLMQSNSSSSETRLQDLQLQQLNTNNLPVMKSILQWLKSLRLHKYSWIFNNLTYQQMLNLNEEQLQSIGITKGARCKLLLSIAKLKERNEIFKQLELDVMNCGSNGNGDLNTVMKKLKNILQTPLQLTCTTDEDLPGHFIKVLGKVCTQLLMLRQAPTEENLLLFTTICERVEINDAFTDEQKRRLLMWKKQLTKNGSNNQYYQMMQSSSINNSSIPSQKLKQQQRQFKVQLQALFPCNGDDQQTMTTQKSSSYPNMKGGCENITNGSGNNNLCNNMISGILNQQTHRHSIGGGCITKDEYPMKMQTCSKDNFDMKYSCSGSTSSSNNFHVRFQENNNEKKINKQLSKDIENSLESLCLQMMEHALGP